jgi:hypothetical protein
MAKQYEARYKMLCDNCGSEILFLRSVVNDPKAVTAVREVCPSCYAVAYSYISGKDAYKPRQATLDLHFEILDVFSEIEPPMTVRQMYYQLTARHVVDKTESGYNKVQRALTYMRRAGAVPYGWLSDNSRGVYQIGQWDSLEDALIQTRDLYRRNLWQSVNAHVEIWLEKRSLVGQLWPVCSQYGVTLFPCGGYSSISFAYEAADAWEDIDKQIYVYHLSDLDADGAYSSVVLENELREHTSHPIIFRRLALSPEQIGELDLHGAQRKQKRKSKRYKWWVDTFGNIPACELDAIHPDDLRRIVRDAIEAHIDPYELAKTQQIEQAEKESLGYVISSLGNGNGRLAV